MRNKIHDRGAVFIYSYLLFRIQYIFVMNYLRKGLITRQSHQRRLVKIPPEK